MTETGGTVKFSIVREERVNYHFEYERKQVIDLLAFCLGEGVESAMQALTARYEALTDTELLKVLTDELDEFGAVYDYIIERSEKYGDVQYNDVTVTLKGSGDDG